MSSTRVKEIRPALLNQKIVLVAYVNTGCEYRRDQR